MLTRLGGLWCNPDFVKLWAGQTVSAFGSMFGALSLTALVYLDAGASELGLLAAAQGLPVLLFASAAGVWVNRLPLRPLLMVVDLGRAAVLLTVPAAALLGALRIEQLYLVAFVFGALQMAFDIAYRSYLPSLVGPDELLEGNSKLSASESVAEVGSPAAGGALVQVAGGPFAVFIDALTFLWSAACLFLIRRKDRVVSRAAHQSVLRDAIEGWRAVWSDRVLRALAASDGTSRFFGGFWQALYALFLIETLGFSPLAVGITIGAGGVGSFVGTWLVGPMTRRFGVGVTLVIAKLFPIGVLIPLANGPVEVAFVMIAIAQLFGDPMWSVYEITSTSLRQSITPQRLFGRVNSSTHIVQAGLLPLGALAAGFLAEAVGARSTLWIAEAGGLFAAAWLVFSPIRRVKALRENAAPAAKV